MAKSVVEFLKDAKEKKEIDHLLEVVKVLHAKKRPTNGPLVGTSWVITSVATLLIFLGVGAYIQFFRGGFGTSLVPFLILFTVLLYFAYTIQVPKGMI